MSPIKRAADLVVNVVAAELTEKPVLRQLMQLYMHDFSEFTDREVDDHGWFSYRFLDHYWTDEDRLPFLIRANSALAGFALVRILDASETASGRHVMAEFFIMRKYRRAGVGTAAARAIFERLPGRWEVEELAANTDAIAFWRQAIPVAFEEASTDEGVTQKFILT